MRRSICLLGLVAVCGAGLSGCGDDEGDLARTRVSVRDRQCIGDEDSCVDHQSYFFSFRSSLAGDFAVTVHDSAGVRWKIHQTGTLAPKEQVDVAPPIPADDVPPGGTIRITVAPHDGLPGSASCPGGAEFLNGCD